MLYGVYYILRAGDIKTHPMDKVIPWKAIKGKFKSKSSRHKEDKINSAKPKIGHNEQTGRNSNC